MDPTEPVNPGGVAVADKPNIVSSGLETPVNKVVPDPLSNLQDVVNAAKQAAAQTTSPEQTPQETQFAAQFGGVVPPVESAPTTPPLAEPAPDLMGQALAGLETPPPAGDISIPQSEQTQPVAETLAQSGPERTPAEELKQQIADNVDAFLEKVTREKVAV